MKLLLFIENEKTQKTVQEITSSINHEIDILTADSFSSNVDFTDYDALVVDKKTWQRNASVLKYFNLLDSLKDKPMLVLTPESKLSRLKFRESKQNIQSTQLPVKAEEFSAALDNLISAGSEM